MANEVEVAPLRSLDDFLLESARFQLPNVKDLEKWGNRVVNNLLYYQSNYFVLAILAFLAVGILHPSKMLCGMLAVAVAFGLFYYVTNSKRAATKFKRDHPILSILIILAGGYFIVHVLGSVVVFLFGILLPIMLVFIHASMRLRNIKNKLTNKIETIGLKKTPMGLFLDALGQEPEAGSHAAATVVQAGSELADKLEEKLAQIGQRMKINRNR
ncbi:PRA1 family protein 3 isoform X1 [Dermacentor albipictus]|uniref:PRA1 family protein 3 isoform X1 n=1 Tax=Dermacentor albipictus TaxID=60249 RepID=UPI0031FDED59